MKDYWTELKKHPGLFYGFLFPALGLYVGITNKSIETLTGSIIFGGVCMFAMGILIWTPILLTTHWRVKELKKKRKTENPLLLFLDNK